MSGLEVEKGNAEKTKYGF